MRTTRAMGAAATMFAVLAAAGCSGGSSGGGASSTASHPPKGIASGESTPPQTSTTSSPASKSSTTEPTPTSKGTAAGAPGVPEPARQHTKAGAKAFASFYFDRVNALYRAPKSGSLKSLESKDCKICASTDSELHKMSISGQKYDRDQIKYAISNESLIPGGANVYLTIKQQPAKLLASDGTVVSTTPTPVVKSIIVLNWLSDGGWRIRDVAND